MEAQVDAEGVFEKDEGVFEKDGGQRWDIVGEDGGQCKKKKKREVEFITLQVRVCPGRGVF